MLFRMNVAQAILCIAVSVFPLILNAEPVDIKSLPKESIKPLYLSQQALKEKNYDAAVQVLTQYMAAAQDAIPLPVFQMLGAAYYQNNDKTNAKKTYAEGHNAFPQNPEMLQNYAVLTYETGGFQAAARLFETLYRLRKGTDSNILYQAAGLYFQAEDLENAKRVLGTLLASGGPLDPKWYKDMIALCVEQKSWQDAEKWARKFLEKEPEQSEYWRLMAQIRLDREAYQEGAAALEIAYRLETPKSSEWLELSQLYLYLNAPLMAIRCMESAYSGNLPDKEIIKISSLYARTQRYDKALAYLEKAIEKAPSASFYFEKGRLLYDAMRYKEAVAALNTCTALDPRHGQAYILAGFAAWNLKQWDTSRSHFAKASTLPKCRDQANEAILVLDDLIAAFSEKQ